MEDLGTAALLGVFIGTVFGVIFMIYFVKVARRLVGLIDALRHESEQKAELNKKRLEIRAEIAVLRERAK